MDNDEKKSSDASQDRESACCYYVVDSCGCYVDPCRRYDPCGCYVDPCCC